MRRKYTSKEFRFVVDFLLSHVSDMTIATDIICGFPTETQDDFEYTLDLISEYKFPIVHISQFYPRPGTPASIMTRLPTSEVKARSRELTTLFDSYSTYDENLGTIKRVLVTEHSGDGRFFVAHDPSYHQVLVDKDDRIMGRMVTVRIIKAAKYYLVGQVIDDVDGAVDISPVKVPMPRFVVKKRKLVRLVQGEVNQVSSGGTSPSIYIPAVLKSSDPSKKLESTETTSGFLPKTIIKIFFTMVLSIASTVFLAQIDDMRWSLWLILILGLWWSTWEMVGKEVKEVKLKRCE